MIKVYIFCFLASVLVFNSCMKSYERGYKVFSSEVSLYWSTITVQNDCEVCGHDEFNLLSIDTNISRVFIEKHVQISDNAGERTIFFELPNINDTLIVAENEGLMDLNCYVFTSGDYYKIRKGYINAYKVNGNWVHVYFNVSFGGKFNDKMRMISGANY